MNLPYETSASQTTSKMARRRTKKRTHVGANNGPAGKAVPANQTSRAPKSMVIRIGAGEVGPSVSQLVKDVRSMLEPGTASRLKERRANRLKDYLTMAGPLGVAAESIDLHHPASHSGIGVPEIG